MNLISAKDALLRLKSGAIGLDVRSSGEFLAGRLPKFVNVPVLHDEHRHLVGLTYKQQGQAAAIALGHELVTPLRSEIVEKWKDAFALVPEDRRLLICWRGGLRSKTSAEWLREAGVVVQRVEGGYKAMRGELLRELERAREFVVVSGMTGVGKTDFLARFEPDDVLDLEDMAKHRGSAFGLQLGTRQPAQQTFDNAIGFHLFQTANVHLLESESRMIGTCHIPDTLKASMNLAPIVVLEDSFENRVQRIHQQYVLEPLKQFPESAVRAWLMDSVNKVSRKLGGLRTQPIVSALQTDLLSQTSWIECLLSEYYDPCYAFSLKQNTRQVLFRGDAGSCFDFLADHLDRRRSQSRSILKELS